jgi:ABC-2 type transport system permease protein/lipopolysaccharide transport system permease protein
VSVSRAAAALRDLSEGARQWPQWFTLGNFEIRLRFRRTGLGPVWTSLSFAILVGSLSFVYGRVLGVGVRVYAPHLALGLLVWTFLATILLESCDVFVQAAHTLKQIYLPRSGFLYRLLWRNLVLLSFNAAVAAAVLILCRVPPAAQALLALPGLLLLSLNLLWIAALLALAGARFWAVSRAVQAALPIAMLVTPILWLPTGGTLRALAEWNPLFFAIELVRGPLLGHAPPPAVWIGGVALAAAGSLVAFAALARWRDRIAYWL